MIDASTSTWAHLVPVLHALGLSVLFLPSTVTVTVCVPAAMASRAQTTRRGWAVGEERATASGLRLSTWPWARPWSGRSVLTQAALPLTVYCTAGTSVAWAEPDARLTVPP